QAEDGIRDFHVTGVQTCALPILSLASARMAMLPVRSASRRLYRWTPNMTPAVAMAVHKAGTSSSGAASGRITAGSDVHSTCTPSLPMIREVTSVATCSARGGAYGWSASRGFPEILSPARMAIDAATSVRLFRPSAVSDAESA